MDDSKLWHLHGDRYDLEPFLNKHPGGKSILIAIRGLPDATPLFESYHAFANRTYIRNQLKEFRVIGPDRAPMYTYDNFYETLVQRARVAFGAKSDSESVTHKIKANGWWWAKILFECALMAVCWLVTFLVPPLPDNRNARIVSGLVTGVVFISLGFNTMHDASHFAIRARNHWSNGLFLRAWTAWALWSGSYWMTHHVVRHHAFTGHPELDPDIQHARPFMRKSLQTPRDKFIALPKPLKQVWHFAVLASSIFALLPGMFVGQILSYSIIWPLRGHLWKMPHPKLGAFDRQWWETLLSLASLLSHFLFAPSLAASAGFLIGCNIAYAICILPDHDTFESAVENHLESTQDQQPPDWGEVQVRHSSDFGKGIWGRAFGEFAGGINFQICHHLFPGVSHVHFPLLTQIVEETCLEFKIPFVRHDSLAAALWSVARTFALTMAPQAKKLDDVVDEVNLPVKQRSRNMDAGTGILFGAWFTLCSMAIANGGRHLLIVPGALVASLGTHALLGAFAAREKKQVRFLNLQSSSRMISLLLAILCVDVISSTRFVDLSSQTLALLGTGVIGAELFALVMNKTFSLAPQRVLADTIKLMLFTVLSYKGSSESHYALLFLCVEHAVTLMSSRAVLPLAWLASVALHATAIYLIAYPPASRISSTG